MLKYAFSQIGVIVLCCVYAVGGANIYMSMEVPLEEEAKELKRTVALDIIDAQDFLADSFWLLIHHRYPEKRLNMTEFEVKVEEDLEALVSRIVTACEENNYDGEIDTWDMAWTFPNALLFTVTIMTTVGYGHISPKSSSGQSRSDLRNLNDRHDRTTLHHYLCSHWNALADDVPGEHW